MEVCSCFRRERKRQSKSTVFLKFVRILKFVKIREFQEFLKFIKFEFSIYGIKLEGFGLWQAKATFIHFSRYPK